MISPTASPAPVNPDDEYVDRSLIARLLAEPSGAESAHFIVILLVVGLLWGSAPASLLAWWLGAIAVTSVIRLLVRRRFSRRGALLRVPTALRLVIVAVALAWGGGAFAAAQRISTIDYALVMVVLCGLSGAATLTLLGDPRTFYSYIAAMLGPAALGALYKIGGRAGASAFILLGLYITILAMLYRRVHLLLLDSVFAAHDLAQSRATAVRERAFLDAMITNAPSPMVVLDAEKRVVRLNAAFEKTFGYTLGEANGQLLRDLVVPKAQWEEARRLEQQLEVGNSVNVEAERQRKDGRRIFVRVSAAGIPPSVTELGGTLVIYDDITASKLAESALREARDAAEQTTAARGAFLANMSHEIRTPINGVLGMAQLLLDSDLAEEDRRAVELILTSGEALMAIITDILDFSKIEAQQMELEDTEFDLSALVESTGRMLMAKGQTQGVELVVDVADTVPAFVVGDPTRLRQILTNLAGNAVKFTERGEIVIAVSLVGPAQLRFTVRDTGIGIPPEKLSAIFEPFRQADSTTTRRFGGTGLGLSISRRLVELMGGHLEVVSEPGAGSTFEFTIRMKPVPAVLAAPEQRMDIRGARLLLVDDNATNRRVMDGMLERAGCTVEQAVGARAALGMLREAAARHEPYQLVITDAFMPDLDGFDLVAAMRNDPSIRDTRAMMVTSGGRKGDSQRCRELAIGAYLLKPLGRRELLNAVAVALASDVAFGVHPVGASRAPRRQPFTPNGGREPVRPMRVLLAEDNGVNQEVAARTLRRRGHAVDIVDNGLEAVEAVKRNAYDVVLMDVQMPEMDGLEATEQIRSFLGHKPLPIIAVTANALAGERERCIAAGVDDYLSKPFKPRALIDAVEAFEPMLDVLNDGASAAPGGESTPPPAPDSSSEPRDSVPAVDLDGLLAELASADIAEILPSLLETFRSEAPQRLLAIEEAARADDSVAMHRASHAFKSSAGAIHAHELAEALRQLEAAAHSGDVALAKQLESGIRREYGRVMDEVAARLRS